MGSKATPFSLPPLLDELRVGVVVCGKQSEIVACNRAALELLGLTAEQLSARATLESEWDVIREDGTPFPATLWPVGATLRQRQPLRDVVMGILRPVDGERVWLLVSAEPQLDAQGEVERVVCSLHDYTQRRRDERALRESQARELRATRQLAAFVDSSPEAILTRNADGTIASWNPAAEKLFGWTAAEAVGRDVSLVVPPDREQERQRLLAQLGPGRAIRDRETVRLHKDGTRIDVALTLALLGTHDGTVLAIFRDIREEKRAAEALRQSESRSRALLGAFPDNLYCIARDGTFRGMSIRGRTVFEPSPEKLLGRSLRDLETMPADLRDRFLGLIGECLDARQVRTLELARLGPEQRDMEFRFVPYASDEALLITRDVSERRELDRMKDEFISVVSHELRTPITSIRGALGLMAGGATGALPDQARAMTDIALGNCERLHRLVDDILELESLDQGKMRMAMAPLLLQAHVRQAALANASFAGVHGVHIELEDSAPPLTVRADPDRLAQVMANLLSNACKFSDRSEPVRVSVSSPSGSARVEVTNRGPPLPAEFRGRVFQKFAQADASSTRSKGGTGLGLSISRTIVETFGGRIGFSSSEEATTFWFELPVAPPASEGPRAAGLR